SAPSGNDGDGDQRGIDPEGASYHRRVVWDKLLQVDGVRVVQSPGPHRQGMERAFAGGGSVPVCDRGCPAAQDPQRRARDPPERRIGRRGECRGYREVLGLMIGDSESEASWSEFFTWL